MNPQEQLARSAYEAFNDRDQDRLRELLSEDVVWETPGSGPTAGTYHGPDEVIEGVVAPLAGAPVRIEYVDSVASDELVAVRADLVIEAGGDRSRWSFIELLRVREGRLVERRSAMDDQEGFDRFLNSMSQQLAGQSA